MMLKRSVLLLFFNFSKRKTMIDTSEIKVEKSSRSSIGSLENSKEEFKALITKMDNLIGDNSQQVRISNKSNNDQIGEINKVKIHRRQLHETLLQMEGMTEEDWVNMRPNAQKIYEEAAATMR